MLDTLKFTFKFNLSCIWCLPGWWTVVSGYKFLTFRLHLWQASSEVTASTGASEVLDVGSRSCTYSMCDVIAVSHL